jgi:hypothetical protein
MLPRIPTVWWLAFPAFAVPMVNFIIKRKILASISSIVIAIDDCKWQVRKTFYSFGSSGNQTTTAHYEKMEVDNEDDI